MGGESACAYIPGGVVHFMEQRGEELTRGHHTRHFGPPRQKSIFPAAYVAWRES
jgi:hypothetical protein